MKRDVFLFLFLCLGVYACNLQEFPEAPVELLISTEANTKLERKFEGCVIVYEIQALYSKLETSNQRNAIKTAFELWPTAHPTVEFVASNLNKANIIVTFAKPKDSDFLQLTDDKGLIKIARRERSSMKQDTEQRIIYLDPDPEIPWTTTQITRAVAYHLGNILGLLPSSNPNSVMWPMMNTNPDTQLSSEDTANFKQLYPNPCTDFWSLKGQIPEGTRSSDFGYSIGNKGYLGQITETYSGGITEKTITLWEFDPITGQWRTRRPQTFSLPTIFSFEISTFMLFGQIYAGIVSSFGNNNPNAGIFYAYNPVLDTWTPVPNFPGISGKVDRFVSAFGNNMAILLTENRSIPNGEFGYAYTPQKGWYLVKGTRLITDIFETSFGLSVRGLPHVFLPLYGAVTQYNPASDRWQTLPSYPSVINQNGTVGFGFSNDDYAFVGTFTDDYITNALVKQFWKLDPDTGWKRLKNPPIDKPPLFAFYLNKKFHIGMDDGNLYEYLP